MREREGKRRRGKVNAVDFFKVGQLSHWVNFLKLNDLGNITFC